MEGDDDEEVKDVVLEDVREWRSLVIIGRRVLETKGLSWCDL